MGVDSVVVGQPVIDDVRKVIHVEAARRHVGGHEQLRHVVAELTHCQVALRLAQVAVQAVGVIAVGYKLVGYFLRLAARTAEDYAVDIGVVVGYTFEGQIFVVGLHHIIYMLDILGTLVAVSGHELHRVVHEALGYLGYLLGHRGREHEHLALFGHMAQNFVDVIHETHVEHLVGLVEDYGVDIVEVHYAAFNEVYESARSGHYNLHALLEGTDLRVDAGAAVYWEHADVAEVFREVGQVAGYLEAEFARGGNDERLCAVVVAVDALEHREAESGGLARAGLRQTHHVAVLVQKVRDDHLLDGHRMFEPEFFYSLQQLRLYA